MVYEAVDYAEYQKSKPASDTSKAVAAAPDNPNSMVAVERRVYVGISFEENIEITSGIEDDLRIVTFGAQSLADGDFIKAKKTNK